MASSREKSAKETMYWMTPIGAKLEGALATRQHTITQIGEMYSSWTTTYEAFFKCVNNQGYSSSIGFL